MTSSPDTTADLCERCSTTWPRSWAGCRQEQLHDPTPCAAYDVAQLRQHVLGWLTVFADGFADSGGQAAADIDGYDVPTDAAAAVRTAARQLDRAVRERGGEPAAAAGRERAARRHGARHDPVGVPGPRVGPGARHRPAVVPARSRPRRSRWRFAPAMLDRGLPGRGQGVLAAGPGPRMTRPPWTASSGCRGATPTGPPPDRPLPDRTHRRTPDRRTGVPEFGHSMSGFGRLGARLWVTRVGGRGLPGSGLPRQGCGWPMSTIQLTPNRSTQAPNSSPHICFSSGTVTWPPSDSFSQ